MGRDSKYSSHQACCDCFQLDTSTPQKMKEKYTQVEYNPKVKLITFTN